MAAQQPGAVNCVLDPVGNGGLYQARPTRVYGFDDIVEAHRVMGSGLAGGNMTVSVT